MKDLERIARQLPRARAKAELPGDFAIENRPAGKIEARPLIVQAPEREGLEVESLGQAKRGLTDAEYAERKRRLPPLVLMPKRKGFDPNLTYDHRRRDAVMDRARAEQTEQAKAELTQIVAGLTRRGQS